MIKKYKLFTEAKKKFPNIKKMDIDGFTVYLGKDSKSNDHLTFNVADENDFDTFEIKLDRLLSSKRALADDMLKPNTDLSKELINLI